MNFKEYRKDLQNQPKTKEDLIDDAIMDLIMNLGKYIDWKDKRWQGQEIEMEIKKIISLVLNK